MSTVRTQSYKVAFPWGQLLSLYSAITFLMLGIDMALLHLGYRHYHFMAVMPIAFCSLAALLSFITTFSRWLRSQAWVLGLLAMVVGSIGTVIHLEIAFTNIGSLTVNHILERLVFDPRPPLAPAALAGTGLLLLLIAVAERWPIHWIIDFCRHIPIVRGWFVAKSEALPAAVDSARE